MAAQQTYDVFVSYGRDSISSAVEVISRLTAAGLQPFSISEVRKGANWFDEVRERIAEAQCFVIVLGGKPSHWVSFELGAAMAWNKPIVVAYQQDAKSYLATFPMMQQFSVTPVGQVAIAVKRVLAHTEHVANADVAVLLESYEQEGVPVDQLLIKPAALLKLTRRFGRKTRKRLSPEAVIKELIRIRKAGHLPRLGRSRAKPRKRKQT